ncbi:hypothetical protein HN709_02875 [Candidatus Peregrinibacteria bacterium]|jgi:hypothetical protein|nr:hypothetical protein [Candidatus Peregrinibacteria bacterium]MBT7736608.1 hypothetical protein [Candidatus Peregrinibacteria bacterium]
MRSVSKFEKKKIIDILGDNPEMLLDFQKKIAEKGVYVENFKELFDEDFFEEFMRGKLHDVLSQNKDLIISKNKNSQITDEHVMKTFEESGSMGITLLVKSVLEKMDKEQNFDQETIDNLVYLIGVRNDLQAVEMEALKDEYKLFLEKQIIELES